jgi:hypothetical protein
MDYLAEAIQLAVGNVKEGGRPFASVIVQPVHLFAKYEEANNWLTDHPVVLGAGAVVLGLILVGLGVWSLVTGHAPTKRGPDLEGGTAKAMGFVWLGFGALCLLFGCFKIVSGLL